MRDFCAWPLLSDFLLENRLCEEQAYLTTTLKNITWRFATIGVIRFDSIPERNMNGY